MKYLKFTYVDSATGIPVTDAHAANGPAFPAVDGLVFEWARESRYPTDVPEFFGTCPDGSDTDVPGVLAVLSQQDWDVMREDEMRARVPQSITMRQCRLQLLTIGKLADVEAAIAALPEPAKSGAQIEWEYAATVERNSPLIAQLGPALELNDEQLDEMFRVASSL
jgi:hypothetical protein